MPFMFGEDSFNTGDSTGVSCLIVRGDLPINIKWTLHGQPLVSGENGVTIAKLSAKSSVLNIGSVEKEHRGIFRCHAENMAGIAEYSSELHVNGISARIRLPIYVICVVLISASYYPSHIASNTKSVRISHFVA